MDVRFAAALVVATLASLPVAQAWWPMGRGGASGAITGPVFYVANAGSDSNDGLSPQTPWQTVTKVNAQTYSCGAQVLFNGGDTFSGGIVLGTSNWASCSSKLVIGSYGTGQATISSGSASGVVGTDIGNVIVQHLHFTGAGVSPVVDGVVFYNTNSSPVNLPGLTINDLTVSNYGGVLVNILGNIAGGAAFTGTLIENNTLSNGAGYSGIYVGMVGGGVGSYAHQNMTISHNSVTNISGSNAPSSGGYGIWIGSHTNTVVEYNRVDNVGVSASGNVGIGTTYAINPIIRFNEVSNVKQTNGIDGEGIDFDEGSQGGLAEYNYVHDCYGAGLMAFTFSGQPNTNNTFRYNITQNNGFSSNANAEIVAWNYGGVSGDLAGFVAYNNTSYNTAGGAVLVTRGPITGRADNNIIFANGSQPLVSTDNAATLTLDGNDYYSTGSFHIGWNGTDYTSLAAWKSATSQESVNGGFAINPLLVSPGGGGSYSGYSPPNPTAYALQSGSPMKQVGIDLNAQFSINPGAQDYYGNPIPNGGGGTGFNVGAYGAP